MCPFLGREREAGGKGEIKDLGEGGNLARRWSRWGGQSGACGLSLTEEEAQTLGQWPGICASDRAGHPTGIWKQHIKGRRQASCKNRYSEIGGENE